MAQPGRIIAGAMSGTSADGIDVALARIEGRGTEMKAHLLRYHHRAYDPGVKARIFQIRNDGACGLAELAQLGRDISLVYAAAVNEALLAANLSGNDLAAVAAHGQTLFHDPPSTIQWFDPSLLAAEVGCPVVSDFRRADCAAGGQGAPLVPFADYILFRHPTQNRVLLNIGGIANITYLPANCTSDQVIAFDTGPGNCVSDWLCRTQNPSGPGYDPDGRGAARGKIVEDILEIVSRHPFFDRLPPKSTDGPEMIGAFESAMRTTGRTYELDDLLATACMLTLQRIAVEVTTVGAVDEATSVRRAPVSEIIASGGGTKNRFLMDLLPATAEVGFTTTDALGIPSEAREALAFALLAAATLDRVPSNVPSATGARRAVVLGSITPKP